MTKFVWKNGNQGFWGYRNLDDFNIVNETATKYVLAYNGNRGPYDPLSMAYRIEILYSGKQTFTPTEGPDAGSAQIIGGTVTTMRYFNKAGKLILEATGLTSDLGVVDRLLHEDPNGAWRYLSAGNNSFVGSGDAGGPDWDGDDIKTGVGRDTVEAGAGDDYISDFAGKDVYRGGAGRDTINYDEVFWNAQFAIRGIKADLALGKITGPDGAIDKVVDIENVRATFMKDTLLGNAQDNTFYGLRGRDVIDGRGGFDMVRYDRDYQQGGTAGVRVDLSKGTARDGYGMTDTLKNIEGARGTETNDVFVGNAQGNWFDGRGGNDIFRLKGGNDAMRGGEGADRFVFLGTSFGEDRIEDFDPGNGDRIEIDAASKFSDLKLEQDGGDALVKFGTGTVRLQGWDVDDLQAGFFIF